MPHSVYFVHINEYNQEERSSHNSDLTFGEVSKFTRSEFAKCAFSICLPFLTKRHHKDSTFFGVKRSVDLLINKNYILNL